MFEVTIPGSLQCKPMTTWKFTPEGQAKRLANSREMAARRLGLSVTDYLERRRTQRWCAHCKLWHNTAAFDTDCPRHQRNKRGPLERRFWLHVIRGPQCWDTDIYALPGEYPTISTGGRAGKQVRMHRVAWSIAHGAIPADMHVLHHCDNVRCVKTEGDEQWPDGHLFLGTNADNHLDKMRKGREARKLSPEQAAEIVRLYGRNGVGGVSGKDLAIRFGVSRATVSHIVNGLRWTDPGA